MGTHNPMGKKKHQKALLSSPRLTGLSTRGHWELLPLLPWCLGSSPLSPCSEGIFRVCLTVLLKQQQHSGKRELSLTSLPTPFILF